MADDALAPGGQEREPPGRSWGAREVAVVSIGTALVVFFAGTTAAVAAGASPPTPLWAAGGALSGGLLGLLAPPLTPRAVRKAAVSVRTKALESAAGQTATAASAAQAAAVEPSIRASSYSTVVLLAIVFVLLLGLAVVLAGGVILPPASFGVGALQNLTKTVVALASAAGSGVIGLLAPAPPANTG